MTTILMMMVAADFAVAAALAFTGDMQNAFGAGLLGVFGGIALIVFAIKER